MAELGKARSRSTRTPASRNPDYRQREAFAAAPTHHGDEGLQLLQAYMSDYSRTGHFRSCAQAGDPGWRAMRRGGNELAMQ